MPAERRALPRDIRIILAWAEKWRAIPTRKEIATELGLSESTVARIARDGGYKAKKSSEDLDALIASIDSNKLVPCGTDTKQSIQGDGCTTAQS